jgi:hypothetical protein
MNWKASAPVRGHKRLRLKLSFSKDIRRNGCVQQRETTFCSISTQRLSNQTSNIPGQAEFAFMFGHPLLRFLNHRWKVCANTVGNAEHQFQRWIAEAAFNKTQHGFRNPGTLRDEIIGEFPAFPLLSQEPDNFIANGFVMADSRHAEAWQEKRVDIYFAIVKHRLVGKRDLEKSEKKISGDSRFLERKKDFKRNLIEGTT